MKIKWENVDSSHHNKKAIVSTPSTPESPTVGFSVTGIIHCPKDGVVPYLQAAPKGVHAFAGWYDVEIQEG